MCYLACIVVEMGVGFYLRVFFMGLLLQNTATTAILVVLCNRHTFRILPSPIPYLIPCLTHEVADCIKCMSYC